MSTNPTKRIPYGIGDYKRLQESNCYYVDKTHHIPLLEAAPFYIFFIRPRRFGKSLWMSLLEYYYDVNKANNFKTLFANTFIGQNPTLERNSYLILSFNFSVVNPDVKLVQQSFESYGREVIDNFLSRYEQFFNKAERQEILDLPDTESKLRKTFFYTSKKNLKNIPFY